MCAYLLLASNDIVLISVWCGEGMHSVIIRPHRSTTYRIFRTTSRTWI